jgi:hypothetical protein
VVLNSRSRFDFDSFAEEIYSGCGEPTRERDRLLAGDVDTGIASRATADFDAERDCRLRVVVVSDFRSAADAGIVLGVTAGTARAF